MKKIILIITLATISLIFSSCGGLKNQSSIHARDSLGGDNLSIKINVKKAYADPSHMGFAINKNINELAEMIVKKDSSLSTAGYQDKFILITTSSNYFLIEQVEKYSEDTENENRYIFFSPIGTFEINEANDKYIFMYIPYHLIKDLANIHYWPGYENAYPKTMVCETFGTIDDFFNFYSKFEQCEVEKETDLLIVTNKINGRKMNLSFSENDNKSSVTFIILK